MKPSTVRPPAPWGRGFALIVGIDDYRAYDASVGNKAGTSNLSGAAADAVRWEEVLVGRLGFRGEDVVVLADPAGPGERATGAAIRRAVDRFYDKVAREPGPSWVVLVFCGHGATTERGPALCPADTTKGFEGAIAWTDWTARAARELPGRAVTFAVDAGFGGCVGKGWRPRTLTPDAPEARLEVAWPHRVVLPKEFAGELLAAPHLGRLTESVIEDPRELQLMQVWADHTGYRVCDIRRAVGEQTIGVFVVTLPTFGVPASSFEPGREHWWWDQTRSAPWPDGFRLVPRPDQSLPTAPGIQWEIYPWASFAGAPVGPIDAVPGVGRFYQLSRVVGGQQVTLDAHLWSWTEGAVRHQSWFTREVDPHACLPFRNDEELVFNRLAPLATYQGDGRMILRVTGI